MARKTAVVCITVLAVFGTTVNAAAVTSAGTSTEYMTTHTIQQNSSALIALGQSSVFVYNTLNTGVKQKGVYYSYNPSSDIMKMQFTGDSSGMESVLLDKNVRSELRAAYDQYLKDFSGHSLKEEIKNTDNIYGAVNSMYRWGQANTSVRTRIKTEAGYNFVKGNPYFTLTLYESTYSPDDSQSGRRTILLTKQQAADLVGYADEEKLTASSLPVTRSVTADVY